MSAHAGQAIPPPPEDAEALLDWADAFEVSARLDDVIVGGAGASPDGTFLPGRDGEALTYRHILLERAATDPRRRRYDDPGEAARRFLHRMARLTAIRRAARSWMDEHGRDPRDEVLAAFLDRLRAALRALPAARDTRPRPAGTYEPVGVELTRAPVPALTYRERALTAPERDDLFGVSEVALLLLGWSEGPLRWAYEQHGRAMSGDEAEVPLDRQHSALEAMIDFVRDPRVAADPDKPHEQLSELLSLPSWRFALGTLDDNLSRLEAAATPDGRGRAETEPRERIAFRVRDLGDGVLDVEPLLQKRGRGGRFSPGSRLPWYNLPDRRDLTAADRRVFQAYDDRFARRSPAWGGPLTAAQTHGILRALVDHPAVFLDGERDGARLDIRQGRLRLRFLNAADGMLTPQFELVGVPLLAPELARSLRDDRHVTHLHRADGAAPQVLLAEIGPEAAALVQALSLAPARFPPEAHDALAARLEALQEAVDIEFPSQWTRTIAPADGRMLVRLELLASGALEVRLAVRPVKLGPVFAPGEGPTLVLEGQGRDRHGARRDRPQERQAGRALAERLGLGGGEGSEPWAWRVGEGDPALHLVATLRELGDDVVVEWADDRRLLALGSVGRSDMRMQVADRHDWFSVEGGAQVGRRGRPRQGKNAGGAEVVPLSELFAAIREGRRYVTVGARGFVRIEDSLREALARAEGAVFEIRGSIQIAAVASDGLMGLVESEAQVEASETFAAVRRRMREAADGLGDPLRLPPELEGALRPYQKAGVAWLARLAHWGAGAVLADEMGLGKTVQTLAMLAHRAPRGPALIVAPTSVVANWIAESARFAPALAIRDYRGPQRDAGLRGLGPGDVVLTSYAIATLDAAALAAVPFASLVLDEAHAIKNATTERAKALRGVRAEWRLGLTGTPIENRLGELWSLMRVITPGLLGSWEQFRARYAVPIEKFGDDSRRQALSALLRPFLLRRTKAEVARELPAVTEVVRVVRLSPEEQDLYEQLRQATLNEIARRKQDPDCDGADLRFVLLAALTRMRQLCCHPRLVYPRTPAGSRKAEHLIDLLRELRDGHHPALVFSQFRSFLELLEPRLRQQGFRVLVLDGTTPVEARERRIAAFQAGEADVFLISLKAGGVGLNLTAADTVIHLDPWWNPAVEDQATARAHRIGQSRPVTVVRLVASGTIEEAVIRLHAAKRALAAGILAGGAVAASLGTDELVELVQRTAQY